MCLSLWTTSCFLHTSKPCYGLPWMCKDCRMGVRCLLLIWPLQWAHLDLPWWSPSDQCLLWRTKGLKGHPGVMHHKRKKPHRRYLHNYFVKIQFCWRVWLGEVAEPAGWWHEPISSGWSPSISVLLGPAKLSCNSQLLPSGQALCSLQDRGRAMMKSDFCPLRVNQHQRNSQQRKTLQWSHASIISLLIQFKSMLCNQWELFHLQQQAPNQVFDVQDARGETAMGDHGGCTCSGAPMCQTAISYDGEGFPDFLGSQHLCSISFLREGRGAQAEVPQEGWMLLLLYCGRQCFGACRCTDGCSSPWLTSL